MTTVTGVGGQIWGPGPNVFFFVFHVSRDPGFGERDLTFPNRSYWGPLQSQKIFGKIVLQFEKMGFEDLECGMFFEFSLCGAPWLKIFMSTASGGRTVKNAVNRLSITTSGPELCRFEVFGKMPTFDPL